MIAVYYESCMAHGKVHNILVLQNVVRLVTFRL
jgi:hypothetical protein